MNKAILIGENGDASTVWAGDDVEIGDRGVFTLVDDSEVDYDQVKGEIIDIDGAVAAAASVLGRKGRAVNSAAQKAASKTNGAKSKGRPSGKLITSWSDSVTVAIWGNETWTLRLYEDRAILKYPTVRWANNSGSLDHATTRITGCDHAALLRIAAEQVDDVADYTERVSELVWDEMH